MTRCLATSLAIALIVGDVLALGESTASAGTPLQQYILSDPEPGWSVLPANIASADASAAAAEQSEVAGQSVAAAYQQWEPPSGRTALTIAILQYGSALPSGTGNADTAATTVCAQTGRALSVLGDPAIPLSEEAVCAGSFVGSNPPASTVIAWTQGNLLVEVVGYGSLSQTNVAATALAQYQAIPPDGIGLPGGHSRAYEIALAAFALAVLVALALVVRSPRAGSRRRAAVALPVGPVTRSYRGSSDAPRSPAYLPRAARGPYRGRQDWGGEVRPPYRPPGMYVPPDYEPPGVGSAQSPAPTRLPRSRPEAPAGAPSRNPAAAGGEGAPSGVPVAPPAESTPPPVAAAPTTDAPASPAPPTVAAGGLPRDVPEPAATGPLPAAQPPFAATEQGAANRYGWGSEPGAEPGVLAPSRREAAPEAVDGPADASEAPDRTAAAEASRSEQHQAEPVAASEAILVGESPFAPRLPTRPVGWYKINGSEYDLAYFDGTAWVARRHWNGRAWVEGF
ncbi:MAG TPA: hypothetical protein VMD59_09820 [Acidimicrobiales bacterium]|nr:hypothetical protein [Acidimicrobiales bacterium]